MFYDYPIEEESWYVEYQALQLEFQISMGYTPTEDEMLWLSSYREVHSNDL